MNKSSNTVGERIRWRRERPEINMSRAELAKNCGLAYSTLADLENGRSETTTVLHKIAKTLKVRPEWLETGKTPIEAVTETSESGWDDVRGYAQAVGLSEGEEAEEYAETHKLKFKSESLRRKHLFPKNLGVVYGKGDSMLPRIRSGDAILFNTEQINPDDEALFVIQVPGVDKGLYSVKRCRQFGDDVYFEAVNPEGDHGWRKPRKMNDPKKPIQIIGRVRWIGSWED